MMFKKYILLFLFIGFCFATCKKYPEGPCFSLRSKKARLTGDWEPITFTANGIDSLSFLKADSCYGYYQLLNPSDYENYAQIYTINPSASCYNYGKWNFSDKKKKLVISFDNAIRSTILGPYGAKENVEWSILKLTNEEIWTLTEYKNVEYSVHFKKVYERK